MDKKIESEEKMPETEAQTLYDNIDHQHSDNEGLKKSRSDGSLRHRNSKNEINFTSSFSNEETDIECKKMCNNYRFGFKKWKGHVTQRPLRNRSQTVQSLYEDVNEIKLGRKVRASIVFDVLYVLLFGWWQSLVYFLLGVIMYMTIVGRNYGAFCFKMSKYYLWPFGKLVYVVAPSNTIYSYSIPSPLSSDSRESQPLIQKPGLSERCTSFWGRPQSYVWMLLSVHILVILHTVVMVISWLFVISIPISKMNLKSISRLLFMPPEHVHVEEVYNYQQEKKSKHREIVLFIPNSVNMYYYKYTIDGMNIILVNLLVFVILTIVFGYTDFAPPQLKCVLGAFAIIPLSYYIGMAIISISAQTSVAVGAFINASFGTIVETIIFVVALNTGKQSGAQLCFTEIVKASLTGSILGCTLLIPGLSMVVGGLKYSAQRFNSKSASVSCLLMFVCVGGTFAPTIFSQVLGDMYCKKCEDRYGNNTMDDEYGLKCEACTTSIFGVDRDTTLYDKHIKPLVYATCILLPIAYIVGLVFTLKTHSDHLNMEFTVEQLERDNSAHEGHSHGSPQWGIPKSILILLFAATLIGVCADIVTENIQEFLTETGMSTYFVSVAFLSLVPTLPEIVNGIQFALQNNVNLGIEIGTSVAIQVSTVEVPLLVLIDFFYPFELYMVFNQVHLWAAFFAVIVINYTFQDGKSDYFQGTMLIFIYLILLCMYFFMPSPGTCVP